MTFKLIYLARRNPAIPAEDWPRAWRSHAAYASQFPVVNATVQGLLYCSRILQPTLDGAACEPAGVSQDYDGVGIASGPQPVRAELSAEAKAKIDQDELRVFSTYSPRFSFHCEEAFSFGGAPGGSALIRFLVRKSGVSPNDFAARWMGRHGQIARIVADEAYAVTRYAHNTLSEPPPPGYPFDGISEMWFADAEEATRALADPVFAPIEQDLSEFCDTARTVTMLTRVIHRWPRV